MLWTKYVKIEGNKENRKQIKSACWYTEFRRGATI